MVNSKGILLPSTYTKKNWEDGGSIPEYKKYIGKYRISNSQIGSWTTSSGFNTKKQGSIEFMMERFYGHRFPDIGWGEFGNAVESVIRRDDMYEHYKGFFDEKEIEILNKIEPLGNYEFQTVYYLESLDVVILGYIDDMPDPTPDGKITLLRDYKTRSKSGMAKLGNKDDFQLDIYKESLKQAFGWEVLEAEHLVIERGGGQILFRNPGAGIGALKVAGGVWSKPYTFKDFGAILKTIEKATKDISSHYKQFLYLYEEVR